jgi:OHCU decarboxylase
MISLKDLNVCSVDQFAAALGHLYEGSPWVARAAYGRRPFADAEALHAALTAAVRDAGEEQQVALIAAHPDLAGRVAREGRLTAASQREQAGAGLDRLSAEEIARFNAGNAAYRARFGIPFVICARANTKASILAELERRAGNDRAGEIETALAEIAKIARFRLEDTLIR